MVQEVQVSGAPTKHGEHWKAPEKVESALKYTALTFWKTFNNSNKRDILQRLKEAIHNMRPVIEEQTRVNPKTELLQVHKPAVKTDPAVTFYSEAFKSIGTQELDYQFHVGYNQIVLQTDEFQCNGSGWIIDYLQHLDLGTCFL